MTIANKSLAVFIINQDVRAISACYDEDHAGRPVDTKLYKTFDPEIQVGDLIVVPADTRLGFTTTKVVEVDVEPDFESLVEVKWIAGRADPEYFKQCVDQESKMIEQIRKAEKAEKRKAMIKTMEEAMGDEFESIAQIEAPAE